MKPNGLNLPLAIKWGNLLLLSCYKGMHFRIEAVNRFHLSKEIVMISVSDQYGCYTLDYKQIHSFLTANYHNWTILPIT
ncbi:hypothetical protein Plhal304r1_c045g0126461 [Plasmopara halstedii]